MTIAAGTSIDVIEMDAASNRSVDDIRDLRERVAYAPAGGRWKVYILDEAHMLTKEAWNAFLKTLEEPPPNTVFVLATTEAHKVMATIADRCQRFDFQRPSLEQISEVLDRVAAAEGIEVEDGAVAMIARSASGSFRDALGTLDQLVAFGGKQVELDDGARAARRRRRRAALRRGRRGRRRGPEGRSCSAVEKMARSGRDPAQFARDLLAHLRHLLVTQTIGEVPNTFVVTATDAERLARPGERDRAPRRWSARSTSWRRRSTAVREGDDARMAVEIALLKAAQAGSRIRRPRGLLRRVERLEKPGSDASGRGSCREAEGGAAGEGVLGPPSPDTTRGRDASSSDPAVEPQLRTPVADDRSRGIRPAGPSWTSTRSSASGRRCSDKLRQTAPALGGDLRGRPAGCGSTRGAGLTIGFPADHTFNKRKAEAPEKRELMADALEAVLAERAAARRTSARRRGGARRARRPRREVDHDALVEKLKSEFDAEEVG